MDDAGEQSGSIFWSPALAVNKTKQENPSWADGDGVSPPLDN